MVTGYEFKKPDDHIHNILQDPTGQHLLVCFKTSQECYYITRNSKKYRQLSKMKVWPKSCDLLFVSVSSSGMTVRDTQPLAELCTI